MGFFDRFRKKETVRLLNGREVELNENVKFIVKVRDPETNRWLSAKEWIRIGEPIYEEDAEVVLEDYDEVKCDVYENNRFVGCFWKVGSPARQPTRKSGIDAFIDELEGTMEKIERLKALLGFSQNPTEQLVEQYKLFKQLQDIFGGAQPDRKDYPLHARLLVDREFRQGIKDLMKDLSKEVGKAFAEGIAIGMGKETEEATKFEDLPKAELIKEENEEEIEELPVVNVSKIEKEMEVKKDDVGRTDKSESGASGKRESEEPR